MEEIDKEHRVLIMLRKVLANIVKDTTPPSKDMQHPLSERTIQDVREAFTLIAARERELNQQKGQEESRPHFTDEVKTENVIPLHTIERPKKKD